MKETTGPSRGIRGRTASKCSPEDELPPLSRSIVGSHRDLCAAIRVASFLARFLRPRAFFPLGIASILCRVQQRPTARPRRLKNCLWRRDNAVSGEPLTGTSCPSPHQTDRREVYLQPLEMETANAPLRIVKACVCVYHLAEEGSVCLESPFTF